MNPLLNRFGINLLITFRRCFLFAIGGWFFGLYGLLFALGYELAQKESILANLIIAIKQKKDIAFFALWYLIDICFAFCSFLFFGATSFVDWWVALLYILGWTILVHGFLLISMARWKSSIRSIKSIYL